MHANELKKRQADLKRAYQLEPSRAQHVLAAVVAVDPESLSVRVLQPAGSERAGLHPGTGGDGTCVCPVELFLAGLASCAGVTLAAVAHAMGIALSDATVRAEGQADFRGTLAVDRQTPVGLNALRLVIDATVHSGSENLDKLLELTHRYCVVHRTLDEPPRVDVVANWKSTVNS